MHGEVDQGFIHIQSTELLFLENELADIGSRALAFSIDLVLRGIIFLVPFIFFAMNDGWMPRQVWVAVLSLVGVFAISYPFLFEALMAGETPGKRLVGIRVLRSDGSRISLLDALIRNVLRLIDSFPGGYLLGMLFVFFERHNRRLGDLVADTIVIYDRTARRDFRHFIDARLVESQPRQSIVISGVERLSTDEQTIVKELHGRLATMPEEEKKRILAKISEKIFSRLSVQGTDDPEILLYELYKRI